MKIELCQTNIAWENKNINLAAAENIISKSDSDCLFFPEMSFTGFSMNTDITGENNNYTVNYMQNLSVKYKKATAFGWVYKNSHKAENHYTFINEKGEILSDYVKIHPFSYSNEDKYFKSGSKITVFKYKDFSICNFICYDLRFPEIFQIASAKADLIIVAANWPKSRSEHWKTLLKARAIENLCYIAAINCVGNTDGIEYSGDSCIINPSGDIIEMLSDKKGNIIATLNNDVKKYRNSFPVKNDRKEHLYKSISL